jgi:hypothetical protein
MLLTVAVEPALRENVTIRLVGSDDLPEGANREAVADITACLTGRMP